MRTKWHWLLPLLVAGVIGLAAGCGGDDDEEGTPSGTTAAETESSGGASGGTLVFAGASDPVVLDGALVSDGESIRVITQVFETLVALKPGTTEPEPGLAESWEPNDDGTVWTFKIRDGVTFHDGETLDAEAVCFNFDRWYNFEGPLQNPGATYYWQVVFGGFATFNKDSGAPEESLYESCEATDATTAVLTLTKPSATFIPALSQQAFSIASPKALQEFKADEGTVDADGIFSPSGTFGTEHPIGTGPFEFVSWTRNDRLVLKRYEDYWGDKAKLDELIVRPIADNAARVQALQTGEIQGYDLVEPQDIATIEADDELQIIDRPAFNVAYVGFNIAKKPTDDPKVREAIAYGLDRESVVDNFYSGRAVVATQFMPPEVVGYADDVPTYEYDPEKAKQTLTDAGYTLPVPLEFWYPTDVSRPYMPDPKRNFEAFAASLNKSGFKVTAKSAPWNPDYLGRANEGTAGNLRMLGWTGDYGDADNFIGTFFQTPQKAWGTTTKPLTEIQKLLNDAEIETEQSARESLYQEANRKIMTELPGVPYAHSKPALAFTAQVKGYVASPTTNESFASVSIEE
ncbi:MAG: ABC transporter substrate-binding protein [Gaiellaceae bacterium MAG52_C11]|nr:ABC transporter substrate-binding protein [Candidatus Gaiellasilicea maunaloa]